MLESINSPEDLKRLSTIEVEALCAEIRELIVESVNSNGGHLGSNLGVVELTVAIHRAVSSPRDVILWDTGHQSYVHKMLTGRATQFEELRKEGGLSGYPSREESSHDWIENSHASTALAYAHGLATAFRRNPDESRRIVAVIGDGALTGGMAYEGLNNLGHSASDVTIVLNDNGRSYAPTIGHLTESLVKIRSNPVYMARQRRLERFAERVPYIGRYTPVGFRASKAAIREALEPQAFFEPLGVRYTGPFDGHDVAEVEAAIDNANQFSGPVVVHVITNKGRGYGPAERDTVKHLHDMGGVKPETYTAAFSEGLVKLADEHPEVVAITAAMPDSTGLLPFGDRFPDRLIDVGIAEQHAITSAAGMAMGGLRPVIALYSTFLTRAFDQVNLDVGLHRQPVIFCLDRAGITGDDGPSHHGVLDMVLLSKVPGMRILCPSSYQELGQMMRDAYDLDDGPVAIRWPKTAAPQVHDDEVGSGLAARKVRSGDDVCIIGVGKMLAVASQTAERLAARGIEATVWDPRCVVPFDDKLVQDARNHRLVVTIEDGLVNGGVGQQLGYTLRNDPVTVVPLGVPTAFIPQGKPDAILERLGLDTNGVERTTLEAIDRLGLR